jgi:predicted signal transduction protein with EAL and GGDEF domain
MYVILLFTLTKSKYGRKSTIIVSTFVFVLNIASTLWFYVYGDLTALSRFNILLFIVVGLAIKPLTRLNFMQWCFTFLTTINIAMMIIILSFHLGRLFSMPQYANTILRLVLYTGVIFFFQRYLRTLYQSIVNNWPIFSGLIICIFLNLSYYFYVTDNIQNTLTTFKWPLLLLVTLSLAAYGTVFYSMKRFLEMYALKTENLKIQKETGRLHQVAMQLEKYANYDTLTGLPNRRFFFEKLGKVVGDCQRDTSKLVLLYIDLDGFKDINDTYGHEVGDEVLITVGNRLLQGVRKTDFVARLGGDEFAVIIHLKSGKFSPPYLR